MRIAWRQTKEFGPVSGVSVARVSQIEAAMSTQEVLNRLVTALGGTLKLIADFGDEQLKIA